MAISPHRVAVLALPSVVPFDLAVPVQVFAYPLQEDGTPHYSVVVCGIRRGSVSTTRGFAIAVAHGLEALRRAQTIVIPGIDETERPVPRVVLDALREAHARGARLVSICTGAFVLAASGLLDNRRATTHWIDAPAMIRRFPRVHVDPDVLYVEEPRLLSSAGVAAGIDLCLHLIRADLGAVAANAAARRMVVSPHRSGGQAQFIPQPIAAPNGQSLEATRAFALRNLHTPLTVARLATHAGLSLRTFARRFREESGTSPLQWLIRQRVLAAQQMLERTTDGVEVIASKSGFGSPVTLRFHFREELGVSPLQYRRTFRLSRDAADSRF